VIIFLINPAYDAPYVFSIFATENSPLAVTGVVGVVATGGVTVPVEAEPELTAALKTERGILIPAFHISSRNNLFSASSILTRALY
jgi:hypothetical protein